MAPANKNKRRDQQTRSRKTGNAPQHGQQAPETPAPGASPPHALPLELQQIVLNTFNSAFPIVQDPEELKRIIQEVKGHLFNRDFSAAFGSPAYLQAYALRWSVARALAYAQILCDPKWSNVLLLSTEQKSKEIHAPSQKIPGPYETTLDVETNALAVSSTMKAVCIGGGAGGEIIALVAVRRVLATKPFLQIVAVDSADWSDPISKLSSALPVPPALSAFSSESAKARLDNQPLLEDPSMVGVKFLHQDVLSWPVESLQETFKDASLCTLMFTLNELFSSSLPKTTAFLLQLTDSMSAGSHLLVIDSPGSYSEISLGKSNSGSMAPAESAAASSTKRYPMKWLLDHTLLEVAGQAEAKWVKCASEDSLWFRIDSTTRERLRYPIELENMRYQLHLYRRK